MNCLDTTYSTESRTFSQQLPQKKNFCGKIFHSLFPADWPNRIKTPSFLILTTLKKKWYYYIYDITNIFSYKDFVKHGTFLLSDEFVQYPCVLSNWDNTPRSGRRGYILSESTPELFRNHLRKAIEQVAHRDFDKRLVFIKSWNEWAEGNYLEPDQMFGRGYLESCRDEVRLAE